MTPAGAVRSLVAGPAIAVVTLVGAASAEAQGVGTTPGTTVPGAATPTESTAGLVVFIVVLLVLAGGALYVTLQARANRLRRAAPSSDAAPPTDRRP